MKLKLNQQGLIPAIAQDGETGKVLMMGYMSPDSLSRTLQSGEAWFYSRSREALWHKGEISGNVIKVDRVEVDCDNDTLLLKSTPTGPACHTGQQTCFFEELESGDPEYEQPEAQVLDELFSVIESRKGEAPEGSYVSRLLQEGPDRIGKKVIEEAGETVIAAKNGIAKELVHEVADLWFHSLVLLSSAGLQPEDIWAELRSRRQ
jgi:phosphoribosyl-ATP pyrophosphohydrolase/phosphoribosyl-AMP cyclohydrolase